MVEKVNKRLDHFESTNYSFLQLGRAQKFTDDFVLVEEDPLPANRQLLEASLSRMGVVAQSSHSEAEFAVTPAALTTLFHAQTEAANLSTNLTQNNSFLKVIVPSEQMSTGNRLFQGSARLTKPRFVMPYKKIALALATMVFVSPIYTQPAQGRMFSGPLVMLDQSESDGSSQTLDVERITFLQAQ